MELATRERLDRFEAWQKKFVRTIEDGAAIVKEMSDAGDNLLMTRMSQENIDLMLGIAQGKFYAPLARRTPERLFAKLGQLPLVEQKRLCEGGTVPVVTASCDDRFICEMLPAVDLPQPRWKQVFDGCTIRSEEGQENWLKAEQTKNFMERATPKKVRKQLEKIVCGEGVQYGQEFFSIQRLESWLAKARTIEANQKNFLK